MAPTQVLFILLSAFLVRDSLAWTQSPLSRHSTALGSSLKGTGEADSSSRRGLLGTGMTVVASTAALPRNGLAFNGKSRTVGYEVQKKEEEWKSLLSPTQYQILRQGGTERPNSSILEGEERPGIYKCAGCGTPLFDAKEKFHSGTGWPSFARGLSGVEVEDVNAVQANLAGAELRCRTCGGHLGDVFADGFLFVGTPAFTSGKRLCIDGAALVFVPSDGSGPVQGDARPASKEPSIPDWLEPPKITAS